MPVRIGMWKSKIHLSYTAYIHQLDKTTIFYSFKDLVWSNKKLYFHVYRGNSFIFSIMAYWNEVTWVTWINFFNLAQQQHERPSAFYPVLGMHWFAVSNGHPRWNLHRLYCTYPGLGDSDLTSPMKLRCLVTPNWPCTWGIWPCTNPWLRH